MISLFSALADPTPQSPARRTSVPLKFLSPLLGSPTLPKSRTYALSQLFGNPQIHSKASVQSWVVPLLLPSEVRPRCLYSCSIWLRPSLSATFSASRSDSGVSRRRLAFSGLFSLSKETRFSLSDNSASRRRIAFPFSGLFSHSKVTRFPFSDLSVPRRRLAFLSAIYQSLESASRTRIAFLSAVCSVTRRRPASLSAICPSLEGDSLFFPRFISHSKETSRFLQRTV